MIPSWLIRDVCALSLVLLLYAIRLNQSLSSIPPEAAKLCRKPWTKEEMLEAYEKTRTSPTSFAKQLPPKQSRRYVVIGGSGLVGGWIVQHLLERGEDAHSIRILDLRPPQRLAIINAGVAYFKTDVTSSSVVADGFAAPWHTDVSGLPLTVFYTVAYIESRDRAASLVGPYLKVNVDGTSNALAAAKDAGCSIFIATGSGSVAIKPPKHFIWPWQRYPGRWFQTLDNAKAADLNAPLENYVGCYAYSKARAEQLVLSSDSQEGKFRTGVIKPGHAIYGHGGENPMSLVYDYLRQGGTPTWLDPMVIQMVSAQNVSLAHLLFEQRLADASTSTTDVGGRSYCVTDPGKPIRYGDFYRALETLTDPRLPIRFPKVPPAFFVCLSYITELYTMIRRSISFLPHLGELERLQPATIKISTVHLFYDDRKAQQELGYKPQLETLEGICLAIREWNEGIEDRMAGHRSTSSAKSRLPADPTVPGVPNAIAQ